MRRLHLILLTLACAFFTTAGAGTVTQAPIDDNNFSDISPATPFNGSFTFDSFALDADPAASIGSYS